MTQKDNCDVHGKERVTFHSVVRDVMRGQVRRGFFPVESKIEKTMSL
jgi:hypothetical protein